MPRNHVAFITRLQVQAYQSQNFQKLSQSPSTYHSTVLPRLFFPLRQSHCSKQPPESTCIYAASSSIYMLQYTMSTTYFPPCGWRASSGLQYLQAVAPICCPPAVCQCPTPVPSGCLVLMSASAGPPTATPPTPASSSFPRFDNPGVNVIPPKNVSTLFIFTKPGPPKQGSVKFQPWQVDSTKTVRDILDYLGKGDEKWSLVEYHETGDGNWDKGITVGYTTDRAKQGISKFGWTSKRSRTLPPVWLATERED